MFRYVALLWNELSIEQTRTVARLQQLLLSSGYGYRLAFGVAGLAVWCTGTSDELASLRCYRLARDSGVVLGTLFHRVSLLRVRPDALSDDSATASIVESAGREL